MIGQVISFVVFAIGLFLLVFGLDKGESYNPGTSQLDTDENKGKSVWMLMGGVVVTSFGLMSLYLFTSLAYILE